MSTDLCNLNDVKAWLDLGVISSWVKNTDYAVGTQIVPTVANGFYYTATVGKSGATEPTWPKTIGLTISDGTITWTCSGITDDVLLSRLITAESGEIYHFIQREALLEDDYEEYRSGVGYTQQILMTKYFPITDVASLTIDNQVIPAKDMSNALSQGYMFDDYSISLYGYQFSKGINNIYISYSAGYDAIPYDVAQACIELVSLRYRERRRIGETSKSLAGETTAYVKDAMTDSILQCLNKYRRVIPV